MHSLYVANTETYYNRVVRAILAAGTSGLSGGSDMTRPFLSISPLKKMLVAACVAVCAWVQVPVALGQHGGGGGHFGGGGFGGGGHFAPPPAAHAPAAHGAAAPVRPRGASAAPVAGYVPLGPRTRPYPPVYPWYGYGYPFYFGSPFWGLGLGWGFNSCWWSYDLFCSWGFGYSPWGYSGGYGYDGGGYAPSNYVASSPSYSAPSYAYGGGSRDLPQLYLKDGTVYSVRDYWLVDNQLHFVMTEQGSAKPVEHVIDFEDLDMQTTINANTQRGFRFVLRNEPLDQYLQDHPDAEPPPVPPRNK
jgi:hypothetical protein